MKRQISDISKANTKAKRQRVVNISKQGTEFWQSQQGVDFASLLLEKGYLALGDAIRLLSLTKALYLKKFEFLDKVFNDDTLLSLALRTFKNPNEIIYGPYTTKGDDDAKKKFKKEYADSWFRFLSFFLPFLQAKINTDNMILLLDMHKIIFDPNCLFDMNTITNNARYNVFDTYMEIRMGLVKRYSEFNNGYSNSLEDFLVKKGLGAYYNMNGLSLPSNEQIRKCFNEYNAKNQGALKQVYNDDTLFRVAVAGLYVSKIFIPSHFIHPDNLLKMNGALEMSIMCKFNSIKMNDLPKRGILTIRNMIKKAHTALYLSSSIVDSYIDLMPKEEVMKMKKFIELCH